MKQAVSQTRALTTSIIPYTLTLAAGAHVAFSVQLVARLNLPALINVCAKTVSA
jgi:hypothetical protein